MPAIAVTHVIEMINSLNGILFGEKCSGNYRQLNCTKPMQKLLRRTVRPHLVELFSGFLRVL